MTEKINLIVSEPASEKDFNNYFLLRWEVLRKPWGEPKGSETDEQENACIHAIVKNQMEEVIGAGRLQFNTLTEAQIRYMAVHPNYRNMGTGGKLLNYLESKALEKGVKKIILQAREEAVNFYISNGYVLKEKTFLIFGSIQHFLMEKALHGKSGI